MVYAVIRMNNFLFAVNVTAIITTVKPAEARQKQFTLLLRNHNEPYYIVTTDQ